MAVQMDSAATEMANQSAIQSRVATHSTTKTDFHWANRAPSLVRIGVATVWPATMSPSRPCARRRAAPKAITANLTGQDVAKSILVSTAVAQMEPRPRNVCRLHRKARDFPMAQIARVVPTASRPTATRTRLSAPSCLHRRPRRRLKMHATARRSRRCWRLRRSQEFA